MVPLREANLLLFTFAWIVPCAISFPAMVGGMEEVRSAPKPRNYQFDTTISREVLENFRYADMLYPDGKRVNHWEGMPRFPT